MNQISAFAVIIRLKEVVISEVQLPAAPGISA